MAVCIGNAGHSEIEESSNPHAQTLNPNVSAGWRQPAVARFSVWLFDKRCRLLSLLLVCYIDCLKLRKLDQALYRVAGTLLQIA